MGRAFIVGSRGTSGRTRQSHSTDKDEAAFTPLGWYLKGSWVTFLLPPTSTTSQLIVQLLSAIPRQTALLEGFFFESVSFLSQSVKVL